MSAALSIHTSKLFRTVHVVGRCIIPTFNLFASNL